MDDRRKRISPEPVELYQSLVKSMADTIASWVPVLRAAERGLEPLLPPEAQCFALLDAEEPGATFLALELWGWTDSILGDNLHAGLGPAAAGCCPHPGRAAEGGTGSPGDLAQAGP